MLVYQSISAKTLPIPGRTMALPPTTRDPSAPWKRPEMMRASLGPQVTIPMLRHILMPDCHLCLVSKSKHRIITYYACSDTEYTRLLSLVRAAEEAEELSCVR